MLGDTVEPMELHVQFLRVGALVDSLDQLICEFQQIFFYLARHLQLPAELQPTTEYIDLSDFTVLLNFLLLVAG